MIVTAVLFSAAMTTTGSLLHSSLGGLTVLSLVAARRGDVHVFHASLLCTLLTAFEVIASTRLHVWPLRFLVPLLVYALVVTGISRYRRPVSWMRIGRFDRNIRLLVSASVVLSGLGLTIWFLLINPDANVYAARIPEMPPWLLPLSGIVFALVNGAMEEVAFRGIILDSLDYTFGAGTASILLQAVMFGAMHYRQGFPNGFTGVVLAAVFGFLLGLLRRKSTGIFVPWAVHVFADIVIFVIVTTTATA
jgi:membrane protease YdiL (CAAX protease family)